MPRSVAPSFSPVAKSLLPVLLLLSTITVAQSQTNGVLREVYYNLPGGSVSDLTSSSRFPTNPDETYIDPNFEAPSNFADSYGQRMRAYLMPPTTGNYVFWTSSDDSSTLYLSTDETPGKKVQIASVDGWTPSRGWNSYPSQKSAAITLTAGKRYYIEVLQKEGTGGDNLAVGWQKPGDAALNDGDAPIPGTYLMPYGISAPIISLQPVNVTGVEGGAAQFSVQLGQYLATAFQWRRDGQNIPGATNSTCVVYPLALTDSGAKFSCFIVNPYGSTNTVSATLTVQPDTTAPTISAAGCIDASVISIVFSEAVEAASATVAANYTVSGGITVRSAAFGADLRTIILTTTPLALQSSYVLSVSNVRDRATRPNTILANSTKVVSYTFTPLDVAYLQPRLEPAGPSSRHSPVTISEIMYHPLARVDGKNLQFVEVFNSSPAFEDIGGYRLAGSIDYTFPTNTIIAGRNLLVVAAVPADIKSVYSINNVVGPFSNALSHASGTVQLLNREGGIVFDTKYASNPPWPTAADGAGHSLVLNRPSYGEANPKAWTQSDLIGGSPGRLDGSSANSYRSVMLNEVLAHTDLPDLDTIELFNYNSGSINLAGCILTDDPTTNKFIIPTNTVVAPLGFIYFDETQLGFRLNAAGETVYLKDPSNSRVIDVIRFDAQENGVSFGRYPDGASDWYRLESKTFGTNNARPLQSDVVINEIMYAPITGLSDDQYVELFNRGTAPLDIGRWTLDGGVKYTFPRGTTIPANGYFVVAKNPARLLTNYTTLSPANTFGAFSGSLSHGGERIALTKPDEIASTNSTGEVVTNTIHIAVDEVTYGTGGRWGQWANGEGSSLELIDPRSNHRMAANWADSDESAKSQWTTIEHTGVLDYGISDAGSLHIIMLGAGECLVDNVEVIQSGKNLITNSTFEAGMGGWVPQGNHEDSSIEPGLGYNGGACLHVRSTDHGDTGANRIRAALSLGLSSGQTVTIRAKVRWLAGWPEILFRLHGNWQEATGNILTASALGTPGAPNSRAKQNAPPAIANVSHYPPLPVASQAVTVTARVNDPDSLASLFLKYRVDPSTNSILVPMVNNGAGLYSAIIPGQAADAIAAFYIEASDNATPRGVARFPSDAPTRECLVRWGDPAQAGSFGTYRLWMTRATFDRWSNREHLSNKPLDCTFVYGNTRVIYNMGGEYSGSPWHSPGFNTPLGNVCDYLLIFQDDDSMLGETAATLQWPGNGGGDGSCQRELTAYWIAEQMGLPYCYRRSINLFINGQRRGTFYEDVQQPNGDMTSEFYPKGKNGDLHKIQVWYEFDNAAATFTGNGASFQNLLGSDGQKWLPFYRWTFPKRAVESSANDYTDFFALIDAVNFPGLGDAYRKRMEAVVDMDNWLKTYAVEHIVGNNDSFAYGGGQNMYTYKPVGDTWKMMIWDIDFAFASEPPTNNVFAGIGRSNGIDFGEPAYLRRYFQILQDIANGPLVSTKANAILDARYNAMIASGVTVDSPASIKDYIAQRRAYLLNLVATSAPSGFGITLNGGAGFSTNSNFVSLTGIAPIGVRSISVNGVIVPVTWTSVSNWTTQLVLPAKTNTLSVVGLDSARNAVSGASSGITIQCPLVDQIQGRIVINEIMHSPSVSNACYVELYNASTNTAFDISGWRVSGINYDFPPFSIFKPQAYIVLAQDPVAFAQAYGSTPVFGTYTGKLSTNGETLRLISPGPGGTNEQVVAEVRYENQQPWPESARSMGSSLQLVDPNQPNGRVANWAAVSTNVPLPAPKWKYVSVTGTLSSPTLYIYLQSAGEAYIDDIQLVLGTVPESGQNLLANGDFEAAFPGPWGVSDNLSGSVTTAAFKHGGTTSLHLVSTATGYTRASSIYQDSTTTAATGSPCTLSFWYLETTNSMTLTLRLSGSGVSNSVDTQMGGGQTPSIPRFTPGSANSVARSLAPVRPLWINEIVPDNQTGATDRFGHHHPWVELYNSGTTNIDLKGLFLANNYTNLLQWSFPAGATVRSNGFLVVWLDGNGAESASNELHAGFTISTNGGSIALVSTNGGQTNIVDYLNYASVPVDHSFGPYPDGTIGKPREFFYTTPGASNNPGFKQLNVFINEWMADNKTTLADMTDPAHESYDDWFEIYNPGDASVDLAGFYFGTSLTNRSKFKIPPGYDIPAHGYLLVWADGDSSQNSTNSPELHVNFKLSKEGDAVGIFAEDGTIMDFVSFGAQATDVSQGRYPDGGAWIGAQLQPTPKGANIAIGTNTPPAIVAIADRFLIEGQTLAINVVASDAETPVDQLVFSLAPGAPTNATINASTGVLAWRPSVSQAPSTNDITVRVTDNGTVRLTSMVTFTVRVAARPKVLGISAISGGFYSLTFGLVPGKIYRIEYKDDLQDSQWLPFNLTQLATEDSVTFSINPSASHARFFRVLTY